MGLRLAPKATKNLEFGEDSITVRTGLSKGDFRKILEALPEDYDSDKDFNPLQADEFTVGIFNALVVGWSVRDEDGEPVPATVENYLALDRESAAEVDLALFTHFNSLSLTTKERDKSKKDGK